jgi:light-regulated signal transduction histidine kinase (bacteriophytochrome)
MPKDSREGAHVPVSDGGAGLLQPRGWMIVCDASAARVEGHSANLGALFPDRREPFIGAALRDLVGSDVSHALRNALSRAAGAARPACLPRQTISGLDGSFDFSVHAAGESTMIEWEPSAAADETGFDRLQAMVDRLALAEGTDKTLALAARLVFSVLNWDLAMALRFGGHGELHVAARQKRPDCPEPPQAEALPWDAASRSRRGLHFVADAAAAPIALTAQSPDLDRAFLRACGAQDAARAAQAGLRALLWLPIMVEGEPWGALAAGDREPKSLSMDERAALGLFGDFLSLSIQSALWRQAAEARRTHAL